jgi:hypothetical protein
MIKCGKCFSILTYFGQKHNCPAIDEGFFDELDGSIIICQDCEQYEECMCCGRYTLHTLCNTCTDVLMNNVNMEDLDNN